MPAVVRLSGCAAESVLLLITHRLKGVVAKRVLNECSGHETLNNAWH